MDIAALLSVASVNHAIWMIIEALIVSVVVIISDRFIAHEMEVTHALAVSIAAFFAIPFLTSAVFMFASLGAMFNIVLFYGLPLVIWIILAEMFLSGADHKVKIELAFIAWAAYLAIDFAGYSTGIPQMLSQYIPF
ncbi:MAG: hypothetical protein HZB67_02975 [Candidatus Aenigmarchaeota archaeon]|nr:hypothetical protein [Candidatus Aenigmarchaeota archaeon]